MKHLRVARSQIDPAARILVDVLRVDAGERTVLDDVHALHGEILVEMVLHAAHDDFFWRRHSGVSMAPSRSEPRVWFTTREKDGSPRDLRSGRAHGGASSHEPRSLFFWVVLSHRAYSGACPVNGAAGEGRVIPLSGAAREALGMWANIFPNRKPNHYVFPSEKYGQGRVGRNSTTYLTDPAQPIGTWKEAWEAAKIRAGVTCRFHDLRHTGCTRLLEAGVSHPVVAEIMGCSASTAIRMIFQVYGHIGLPAPQRN